MTREGEVTSGRGSLASEIADGILFACNLNSVRSPMAAEIARQVLGADVAVDSVGVYEGFADPFAAAVMEEAGYDLSAHAPKTFGEVQRRFGLIIALTPDAYREASALAERSGAVAEYWPIPNPSEVHGARDQILESYRQTRDELVKRIRSRFADPAA